MSIKLPVAILIVASALLTACSKKDTTAPVITLKGNARVEIILNTPYTDAGATASDNADGFLTVSTSGTVDTNFAGNYYITYKATDAAGNEGQATRTVVVRNQADVYNGSYNAMSVINPDTTYYVATSNISNVLNNRVWLVGYSDLSTAVVYADFRNDTISIPHQIVNSGSPSIVHSFSGNGFIKTISGHTVFDINFTDSISGNIYHGTSVYTKTN